MILDACESPTRRLSYVLPFISHFDVFYVKIYRMQQSVHTDNSAIRASLGIWIDACKSSTLELSHASKFDPKFALVADFLVIEKPISRVKPRITPFAKREFVYGQF